MNTMSYVLLALHALYSPIRFLKSKASHQILIQCLVTAFMLPMSNLATIKELSQGSIILLFALMTINI